MLRDMLQFAIHLAPSDNLLSQVAYVADYEKAKEIFYGEDGLGKFMPITEEQIVAHVSLHLCISCSEFTNFDQSQAPAAWNRLTAARRENDDRMENRRNSGESTLTLLTSVSDPFAGNSVTSGESTVGGSTDYSMEDTEDEIIVHRPTQLFEI